MDDADFAGLHGWVWIVNHYIPNAIRLFGGLVRRRRKKYPPLPDYTIITTTFHYNYSLMHQLSYLFFCFVSLLFLRHNKIQQIVFALKEF